MGVIAAASVAVAIATPRLARSADHLDGPAVRMDNSTDINDLYVWNDGGNSVFALTVFPAAPATAKFSDQAAYVIHTSSGSAFGMTTSDVDIICTFNAAQVISCWAGDEYVTGDASQAAGITSTSGKMKVFAGRRADPFFFNLDGFNATRDIVITAAPALQFDGGCPTVDPATSTVLVNQLKQNPEGGAPVDFFANLNTLAIVVSVEKSVVTKGGKFVAAWASTNRKM
jgi:hypothetical protein